MKRVCFSDYVTIRPLFESDACREARQSDWMRVTRNRHRFRQRIKLCAKLVEYCLKPVHRIKIKRLFLRVYCNKTYVKKTAFVCPIYISEKARINKSTLRSFSVRLDEKRDTMSCIL